MTDISTVRIKTVFSTLCASAIAVFGSAACDSAASSPGDKLASGGSTASNNGNISGASTSTDNLPVVGQARKSLGLGSLHSCALLGDTSLWCWGGNGAGQLGDGGTESIRLTPVQVTLNSTPASIAAAGSTSYAIMSDGSVQTWGGYQFFDGMSNGSVTTNAPVTVPGVVGVKSIGAGSRHSCAVLQDGRIQCWGDNQSGQLGDGTAGGTYVSPVIVFGISTAVAVAVGHMHSCAVLADGRAQCWGSNGSGQIGNGCSVDATCLRVLTPTDVVNLSGAVAIASGEQHACALLADGTVNCWGYGVLGDGTDSTSYIPVKVSGIDTAVAIAAGGTHSCVVLSNGKAKCWGTGAYGQLGDGGFSDSWAPVDVAQITNATEIACGDSHTCAALSSGQIMCWGYNTEGQVGIGSNADALTPKLVTGLVSIL